MCSKRRLVLATAATTVALLVVAATAMADSASISVTTADGRPDAVAYLPRTFIFSGTTTGTKRLYVKHRAPGGAPCAPSAYTDAGTWLDSSFYGQQVSGSFSFQRVLTWRSPGAWMFCFWLATDEPTVVPPLTQTITFRPSAGTIGATVTPAVPRPGQPAQITVAGSSEAPKRVYAKLRAADGRPCAASYDADPGGTILGGWSVEGNYSITEPYSQAQPGQYALCLWLAGSSDDTQPIGGPQQQTFTIAQPPPPLVSSVVALNCRTKRPVERIRARKVKSVCMRYRFSRPPAAGQRLSVAYVTPRHVTYKTLSSTWPAAPPQTMTTGALPVRAYKHRRGVWYAVLRVDGAWIKTKSFRIAR